MFLTCRIKGFEALKSDSQYTAKQPRNDCNVFLYNKPRQNEVLKKKKKKKFNGKVI